MSNSHELNLNATECLRTVTDLGVWRVHNICSGTISEVSWGQADWALFALLAVAILFLTLMIGSLAISMVRGR